MMKEKGVIGLERLLLLGGVVFVCLEERRCWGMLDL
jgi:hypothetical protein